MTAFVLCFTATRREDFSKLIRSDYIRCTTLVGVISVDLCAWFCHNACCEYQWSMIIAIATCAHASQFFSENGYYSNKQARSRPIQMKICNTKTIPCYLWLLRLRWLVYARHTQLQSTGVRNGVSLDQMGSSDLREAPGRHGQCVGGTLSRGWASMGRHGDSQKV